MSLVFHGLLLSAVLPLFRWQPIAIPPEPFRWDVPLIRSTQPADEPVQTAEAIEPTGPIQTRPVPLPADMNRPILTVASSAEDIVPVQLATETPVTAEPQPVNPPAIAAPEATAPAAKVTDPASRKVAEEPAPSISASEEQPVTALRTSQPAVQQTEPPAAPTAQEPPAPAPTATNSGNIRVPASDSIRPTPATMAPPAQTNSSPATHADYGWLQRAVSRRLEDLKRASRPSLEDSRQLKVLVKAVISSAGELLETEIAKSSGLERIDQEAMTLVQRAFPMSLDHNLDRPRIVMRIPVTYSRD